ncbi:MAG TPA: restriction endonuclease subunit R, partial [Gammaproteobacteria bacterium]|nr:restriction endonuclease subunit R [Gammaproteobacteria bacterium]
QENLIKNAQQANYWATVTDEAFDKLADKLTPLMKFREQQTPGDKPVTLDLEDEIHKKEKVHFGPQNEAVSISRYREMVEQLVLSLTENNLILQKLQQGQNISDEEAGQLAELLHEEHPHITEDLLQQVYQNRKARFIQFIRHILGIERLESFPDTVSHAFDQFIAEHSNLNSRQLEFLRLLKDFMIEREKVEKRDLIQSPFTVIHPQGIRGVFTPKEIEEILALTEQLAA